MNIDTAKLDLLEEEIKSCGAWAVEKQCTLNIMTKEDKTPVTEVDLGISTRVLTLIKRLFPEAAIITEEEITEKKEDAPYTFVLDPIDGTDVFSQGLPSFCIALGILDPRFEPVGAMIYAPRFGVATEKGMFLRLDPGKDLILNGEKFVMKGEKDNIRQICISSTNCRTFEFKDFPGKCRIFGSNIIHVLAPVIFPGIQGSINERCYIWDYAAAYAIVKWGGMNLRNVDGSQFVFGEEMRNRKKCPVPNYGGTEEGIRKMMEMIPFRG